MSRVKYAITLLMCGYLLIVFPLAAHLKNRPLQIKLGYMPDSQVIKVLTADQRYFVADLIMLKVILYYGELLEKAKGENLYASEPDYAGMFKLLQTALYIDPYNQDPYYFVQAAFTWDLGWYREVNSLLDYGIRYRTWDYQLNFFAGFNAGYFLKDYKAAAVYMQRAAEMEKEQQFATLASRYFFEANEHDVAIAFLKSMRKSARDDKERKLYDFRLKALLAAKSAEDAIKVFRTRFGRLPQGFNELVVSGLLSSEPIDPYGGRFYMDENAKVRTTSNFTFAGATSARTKQQ